MEVYRLEDAEGAEIPLFGEPHRLRHQPDLRGTVWRDGSEIHVAGRPEHLSRRVKDWLVGELGEREFLLGDRFTVADGYLFTVLGWAGLVGFSVSNLRIPGFEQPWEQDFGKPSRIVSAFDIMQEGPLGGAAFKLGAFPFHAWIPDVYQGAPTPTIAFPLRVEGALEWGKNRLPLDASFAP